ncbi:FG-GAP repeat domain-containing protein [Lysobacter tyrosinilyticus]
MRKIAVGVVAGLTFASGAAQAAYSVGNQQKITMPGPVWQVKIGDVTGDGRNDVIALTNNEGTSKLHVFAQKADGTLTNPPRIYSLPYGSRSLALGDLNRDGIQDVVVGSVGSEGAITVLSSDVTAPIPLKVRTWNTGAPMTHIALGKIDRDDFLDVVVIGFSAPIQYFRGDGAGALQPAPIKLLRTNAFIASPSLEAVDVDGNGAADVIATDFSTGAVHILYNNQGGFFRSEIIDPGFPVSKATARDVNGDGRADLIVTNASLLYIYYQQPTGERFPQADVAIKVAYILAADPVLAQDLDNDGDTDLLTSPSPKFGLVTNNGQALGTEVLQDASLSEVTNIAAGDINSDGCPDVVAGSFYAVLGVIYGSGCTGSAPAPKPDLALDLTASATAAKIKLSTIYSAMPINQPLVEIAFSLTAGSIQVGTLPANCELRSQSVNKARVDCLVASMGSATSKQLSIPVQITTPPGVRARLGVAARALTDTRELSKTNNAASVTVGIVPVATIVPTRMQKVQIRSDRNR